ncbi:galactose-1-epimerase, partial [Chitinophagales bacterium]|nr:galactose-1-epimerase [Chitinophagales bacterium]
KTTIVNCCNHSYFNLAGSGTIRKHSLQIFCDGSDPSSLLTENDEDLIPTGSIIDAKGSVLDFSSPTPLVGRLGGGMLKDGIDHNFVIRRQDSPGMTLAATITFDNLSLSCFTNQPGLQVYTANHFEGDPAPKWGGICLETQRFPDALNHPDFPNCVLEKGMIYCKKTIYQLQAF